MGFGDNFPPFLVHVLENEKFVKYSTIGCLVVYAVSYVAYSYQETYWDRLSYYQLKNVRQKYVEKKPKIAED